MGNRKRDDNRLSPAEVLGQETSKLRTPEQLHRIFYATRFLRRLDRLGYAHFRRWKLYGEEAQARHPTVIWLHGDALTVEYQETPLAQYTVRYQLAKKHFREVPDDLKHPTAQCKDDCGSWMRPCGTSPSGSQSMPLERNNEKRQYLCNYRSWKNHTHGLRNEINSNIEERVS